MTPADAQAILAGNFAPWVQDLNLRAERVDAEMAVLRLPFDAKLVRVGGIISGQALMGAADTAMVIAVSAKLGAFKPMATIGQTISFLRPVANDDVLVEARVLRLGQTLAFGEVALRTTGTGSLVAHATTTYALPAER
jgi:uncharacterized protein (TIGR00369 family)